MLGATFYPITIAEMGTYAQDEDEWFKDEEHEQLKTFLALHPESGDVIPGTGGIRRLWWPLKNRRKSPGVRVVYFFRDLNMRLYMLALYRPGERIDLGTGWRKKMIV